MNTKPIVVLVENDSQLLKATERLLVAYGYEAETHASAESFLLRNAEKPVDCLVLDINLDGISGIELQKKLLKLGSAPPIIFITGQSDSATLCSAIDQGCIAFLNKPFEGHFLHTAIQTALGL
ncbi:MAG: response regulator [Pseudomonadota bacterium]